MQVTFVSSLFRRIRTAHSLGAGCATLQLLAAWDIAYPLEKSAVGSGFSSEGSLGLVSCLFSSDFVPTGSFTSPTFPRGGLGAFSLRRQDGEP